MNGGSQVKYKVLFADDNPHTLKGLQLQLSSHLDIEPVFVSRADEAIGLVKKDPRDFAAVVLDFHFDDEDTNGAEVAKLLFAINKKLSIIVCTGDSSSEPPIQSLKAKVSDFIAKEDVKGLITAIRNCFPYYDQVVRTFNFKSRHVKDRFLENEQVIKKMGMIGRSDELRAVCDTINKIKDKTATALIRGESGTGKELVAQAIHDQSERSRYKFIPINCAAISPNLLESELFGHEKGSFTGADKKQQGKFELANHGTIFLDEIGEMPMELQSKLLRVLQERECYPVGGTKPIKLNVRVVAATNIDILKNIKEGKFREDLYFRLSVIPIDLTPLRNRKADIEPLVNYFKETMGEGKDLKFKTFQLLENYDWPGNIRELKNTMEKLFALSNDEIIGPEELSEKFFQQNPSSLDYDCDYDSFMKGINEYAETQEAEYFLADIQAPFLSSPKHQIDKSVLQSQLLFWTNGYIQQRF